ncbi:MAG: type II toxin-antitoxin system Phd/YefM family antitoxin [Allosphingosinicella sp.]|uniref:type II toxin-antitoxin system Phd/YefM family antitoxin n=1 Tax=Allosphingosinicella sp. TaxID=2823234 RepID=UPI00393E9A69
MAATHRQIGVRELRGKLSEVLRQAEAGAAFVVVSRGRPIAELKGIAPAGAAFREPGALAGKIWIGEDFDALPDDMLDAIEQEPA